MGVPVNSLASPRFCGVRTFQRLPHSADCSATISLCRVPSTRHHIGQDGSARLHPGCLQHPVLPQRS
ncbi:MAG: hypothetical protein ACLR7Z_14360 [Bilophila wadsworthia]